MCWSVEQNNKSISMYVCKETMAFLAHRLEYTYASSCRAVASNIDLSGMSRQGMIAENFFEF